MQASQKVNPDMWTMTMRQWCDVLEHCVSLPQYAETKQQKRFVTMYDLNRFCFLSAWDDITAKV